MNKPSNTYFSAILTYLGVFFVLLAILYGPRPADSRGPRDAVKPTQRDATIVYTASAGETINEIADKFALSPATIVWANPNTLSGRAKTSGGEQLTIPPADIAITSDPAALAKMQQTHLPVDAVIPRTETYFKPDSPYISGWCTSWVFTRGGFVPWRADAKHWATKARQAGWIVDNTPEVGSIYNEQTWGPYGHVVLVVATLPDGRFIVSEEAVLGLGHTDFRIVPAGGQGKFIYYPV